MANKIQLRRDTSSNWTSSNPTLSQGELGHETNTGKLKVGDGSTAWNSLGYVDTTYSVGDGGLTQNNFTDADHSKLDAIEANATADQTASEIKTAYESNSDTNAFTDAEKTKLSGIAASANNYVHPNHSGEVTSTADGATVIADGVVDEANLKVSNSPTDGYVLTAQSGNTGGLTWAAASGGGGASSIDDLSDAEWDGSNLSIGTNSFSSGTSHYRNVAIGWNTGNSSITTGDDNVLIGRNTGSYVTTGTANTAVGQNALQSTNLAKLTGSDNVGIGQTAGSAVTSGSGNTFVGSNTNGTGNVSYQTALGYNAKTAGAGATAINNSYASGADSFAAAIANNTSSYGATGTNSVSIGYQAKATQEGSLAFGHTTTSTGQFALALGYQSTASGTQSTAIGRSNTSSSNFALSLGYASTASASNAVAIGDSNTASHANSIVIGDSVQSTTTNEVSIGGTADTVRISESYTLPTSDGSANQVLTTNGSGVASWAAASGGGGGGGADLYAANESSPSAQPSATGLNAIAIGDSAIASGSQAVALSLSRASGSKSFAAGIGDNSSSYGASSNNTVAIGGEAKASSGYSTAIGYGASSTSGYAIALNGATASGTYAFAVGSQSTASAEKSIAIGWRVTSNIIGKFAVATNRFASNGDNCSASYRLQASTTDATATVMTTNQSSASSNNQIVAASDTAISFLGTITAIQNGAQAYASWKVEGLLVNDGGTTTLVNSAITVIQNSSNWGMALSADNTNNALAVTCTGEASHNIRWMSNIQTSEVTYS